MIIEILKPYGKWQPGAKVDILRSKAQELFSHGIARPADDQTTLDRIPAKEETPKTEPVVVNNYFFADAQEVEAIDEK